MSEIRFEGCWEQDSDIIVRREGDRLVVELRCEQRDGVMSQRVVLDPMQMACDIENGTGVLAVDSEGRATREDKGTMTSEDASSGPAPGSIYYRHRRDGDGRETCEPCVAPERPAVPYDDQTRALDWALRKLSVYSHEALTTLDAMLDDAKRKAGAP